MHRPGRYASLREGLVGAWCPSVSGSFGYSLPDLSGYGNHGTLTNMDPPNDWVASGGNMALDFDDSNDYISLATGKRFQPDSGESFTIAAWVRPTSSTTQKIIFGHGANGPNLYLGYLGGQFLDFAKGNVANTGQSVSTTPISADTWQHVACTVTVNSDVQLFVNGVQKSSVAFNYTFSYAKQLRIGFSDGDIYILNSFGGQINDVRYYTRKLSQSELSLLYTGGHGVGLIPNRRRWFYFPSAFTGTASLTTGAATASGSATFTPKFTATSAVTTKGVTCSGSATFTKPVYTGTSTVTIAAATCSGSATFTAPTFTAAASVTIAAATCSATGTFVTPVYTGTSVLTVGAATGSGAATFTVPVYTASASVAVGATVVNVAGSVVSPTYTAAAAVSVPAATVTATGTFSQFSQITASKPRRLNIVTHRASLNIATHAHVST